MLDITVLRQDPVSREKEGITWTAQQNRWPPEGLGSFRHHYGPFAPLTYNPSSAKPSESLQVDTASWYSQRAEQKDGHTTQDRGTFQAEAGDRWVTVVARVPSILILLSI